MRIAAFARFNKDDFRNAPDWFLNFLDNINVTIDSLNPLIAHGIDIDNNMLAERQTIKVTHNVPLKITLRSLSRQPTLIRVGYAAGHLVSGASITGYNTDGSIMVTILFSDAPTTPVLATVVFEP